MKGGNKLSKKKVLKVDKLVIRADRITVEVDGKEVDLEELRQNASTELEPESAGPWDFFGSEPGEEMEGEEGVEEEAPNEENEEEGWSWI